MPDFFHNDLIEHERLTLNAENQRVRVSDFMKEKIVLTIGTHYF